MPERIQRLEAEQLQLQTAIADPKLFKDDPSRAAAALQRLQPLASELDDAYAVWDALESRSAADADLSAGPSPTE
jgi:ABC transport system ATP-binding/permease protein